MAQVLCMKKNIGLHKLALLPAGVMDGIDKAVELEVYKMLAREKVNRDELDSFFWEATVRINVRTTIPRPDAPERR